MLQSSNPATSETMQAVSLCTQAFHRAKAEHKNQHDAGTAFLAELPILADPASFQAWFACLGQGLALGVIDVVDLGRYCHLARMAMSAWKLAHPTPPKGNHIAHQGALKPSPQLLGAPQNSLSTPTKGNHFAEDENRIAASQLPDIETQHALYKSLRQRGIPIPSNSHLRKNPVKALFFCNLAKYHLNEQPAAA